MSVCMLCLKFCLPFVCVVQKNDSEKMLLRLQRDHQQQQEDLQRRQSRLEKMATSEATVKHQEKVNSQRYTSDFTAAFHE